MTECSIRLDCIVCRRAGDKIKIDRYIHRLREIEKDREKKREWQSEEKGDCGMWSEGWEEK